MNRGNDWRIALTCVNLHRQALRRRSNAYVDEPYVLVVAQRGVHRRQHDRCGDLREDGEEEQRGAESGTGLSEAHVSDGRGLPRAEAAPIEWNVPTFYSRCIMRTLVGLSVNAECVASDLIGALMCLLLTDALGVGIKFTVAILQWYGSRQLFKRTGC